RAIMNGEEVTGITTFFLRQEIDTGQIIFRESLPISSDETAGELHDRMMVAGAELILKTVKAIEQGKLDLRDQSEFVAEGELLKTAPKIFTEDCRINWNQDSKQIHNQIRGLSPFPGAFTHLMDADGNKMLLKIYKSKRSLHKFDGPSGTIHIENNCFFINCSDFSIEIAELQQEGKKRIPATEFIKGFRREKGWKAVNTN
ncbi:MAG TPA: formyltransferase family protein, partial [Bacteroidia bacterium]|nr:formyltransferase family protein [Bacteroidia bacterium]